MAEELRESGQQGQAQPAARSGHRMQTYPMWRGLPNGGRCAACGRHRAGEYCSGCWRCERCCRSAATCEPLLPIGRLQLSADDAQPPPGRSTTAHECDDDLGIDLTATPAAADAELSALQYTPGGTPRKAAPDAPMFTNPLDLLSDEDDGTGNAASDGAAFGLDLSSAIGVRPRGAFGTIRNIPVSPKQSPMPGRDIAALELDAAGARVERFGAEQYTSESHGCWEAAVSGSIRQYQGHRRGCREGGREGRCGDGWRGEGRAACLRGAMSHGQDPGI